MRRESSESRARSPPFLPSSGEQCCSAVMRRQQMDQNAHVWYAPDIPRAGLWSMQWVMIARMAFGHCADCIEVTSLMVIHHAPCLGLMAVNGRRCNVCGMVETQAKHTPERAVCQTHRLSQSEEQQNIRNSGISNLYCFLPQLGWLVKWQLGRRMRHQSRQTLPPFMTICTALLPNR